MLQFASVVFALYNIWIMVVPVLSQCSYNFSGPADVVFMVDRSQSITTGDFTDAKVTVKSIVRNLMQIGPSPGPHFVGLAVFTYASTPTLAVDLIRTADPVYSCELFAPGGLYESQVKYDSSMNNEEEGLLNETSGAIVMAEKLFKTRPATKNILFLVTDFNFDEKKMDRLARNINEIKRNAMPLEIYGISFGGYKDVAKMDKIVGPKCGRLRSNWNALATINNTRTGPGTYREISNEELCSRFCPSVNDSSSICYCKEFEDLTRGEQPNVQCLVPMNDTGPELYPRLPDFAWPLMISALVILVVVGILCIPFISWCRSDKSNRGRGFRLLHKFRIGRIRRAAVPLDHPNTMNERLPPLEDANNGPRHTTQEPRTYRPPGLGSKILRKLRRRDAPTAPRALEQGMQNTQFDPGESTTEVSQSDEAREYVDVDDGGSPAVPINIGQDYENVNGHARKDSENSEIYENVKAPVNSDVADRGFIKGDEQTKSPRHVNLKLQIPVRTAENGALQSPAATGASAHPTLSASSPHLESNPLKEQVHVPIQRSRSTQIDNKGGYVNQLSHFDKTGYVNELPASPTCKAPPAEDIHKASDRINRPAHNPQYINAPGAKKKKHKKTAKSPGAASPGLTETPFTAASQAQQDGVMAVASGNQRARNSAYENDISALTDGDYVNDLASVITESSSHSRNNADRNSDGNYENKEVIDEIKRRHENN